MNLIGYRITTLPMIDGTIAQKMEHYEGDTVHDVVQWEADTREQGIRDALVQLGWTPPPDAYKREEQALPLERDRVRAYLDHCIRSWRHDERDFAPYYVDAFQSVRSSLLDNVLPAEGVQDSRTQNDL